MATPLYGQRKTIAFLCYENTLGQHTQKPKSQHYKNGLTEIRVVQSAATAQIPLQFRGQEKYPNIVGQHLFKLSLFAQIKGRVGINWSHKGGPKWPTAPTCEHSDPIVKKWLRWLYLQFHRHEVYFSNFDVFTTGSNRTMQEKYHASPFICSDSHVFKKEKEADEIIYNIL